MLSFWGFLILLFLFCFFRHFTISISIDYQYITSNQQDFKNIGHYALWFFLFFLFFFIIGFVMTFLVIFLALKDFL